MLNDILNLIKIARLLEKRRIGFNDKAVLHKLYEKYADKKMEEEA